ncbi:hypothetical protein GBAR_LOCUS22759, partial [Geodia barretti]
PPRRGHHCVTRSIDRGCPTEVPWASTCVVRLMHNPIFPADRSGFSVTRILDTERAARAALFLFDDPLSLFPVYQRVMPSLQAHFPFFASLSELKLFVETQRDRKKDAVVCTSPLTGAGQLGHRNGNLLGVTCRSISFGVTTRYTVAPGNMA